MARTSVQRELAMSLLADGRPVRKADLVAAGVHSVTLSRLTAAGAIDRIGSGLYRLAGHLPESTGAEARAAEIAVAYPDGVVCLLSAARVHGLTDVCCYRDTVAVPKRTSGVNRVRLEGVRELVWTAREFFEAGIEERSIDGVPLRLTTPARTVADMFRLGNFKRRRGGTTLGGIDREAAMQALQDYVAAGGSLTELGDMAALVGVNHEIGPLIVGLRAASPRG